jgi:hypothetical protein
MDLLAHLAERMQALIITTSSIRSDRSSLINEAMPAGLNACKGITFAVCTRPQVDQESAIDITACEGGRDEAGHSPLPSGWEIRLAAQPQ